MNKFEALFSRETPKLLSCVHCGLCLEDCPTYQLSGDESNSPRGRLAIWRAIAEKRIEVSPETDYYTDECVGCLACQSVCPANVPYAELLHETRKARVAGGMPVDRRIRVVAALARRPGLFNLVATPLRALRRLGMPLGRFLFRGPAPVFESTSAYARRWVAAHNPSGPTVALLAGCLMDAVYREINFATIRVLVANGVRVVVPDGQTCCGAVHEHSGLAGKDTLDARNRAAFDGQGVDAVIANASGCALTLSHALRTPVQDVASYLGARDLRTGAALDTEHIYYDMPCHLTHGLGIKQPPARVLDATKTPWSLAPDAERCCGSGGTYNVTHAANAESIIREKSAFLNDTPHRHCTLVTANHVCMMQWHSAIATRMVTRPVDVRHLVQVLDDAYQRGRVYQTG